MRHGMRRPCVEDLPDRRGPPRMSSPTATRWDNRGQPSTQQWERRCRARGIAQRPSSRCQSDFGAHWQRWSGGTPASACSMCWPHPAQVGFPQVVHCTR
jgi:hypothetical protein